MALFSKSSNNNSAPKTTVASNVRDKLMDFWAIWCPLWLGLVLYGISGKISGFLIAAASNTFVAGVIARQAPTLTPDKVAAALQGGVSAFMFGLSAYALFLAWRRCSAKWNNWFPAITFMAKGLLYFSTAVVLYLLIDALQHDLFNFVNLSIALLSGFGLIVYEEMKDFFHKDEVRRGATVGEIAEVNAMTKKLPRDEFKNSLVLSKLRIPRNAEPYHFMVVGSTGSGKSVAITNILDQIEARGDIALVVDSGGEFSSRYFQPGRDALINPFDDRCAPWSPTAELEGPWDAEALAKSMVPDGTGDSKEWNGYAQTFVTAVLRKLSETKNLSIRSLLYYVQTSPLEELAVFLKGTAAAAQMGSDKTFGSIRTIATKYLATYGYLLHSDTPFSVANFIRQGKPGFLFFTYRDDQLDSLRDMISCALDVAARTILALPASKERRIWLIIDEFASIGKVQSIEAVATKARKMGGCLLLGLQSVSQLKERYGENTAQTILSCLSSWLILRVSDADTSEYISKYIGEREISRMTKGTSKATENSSSRNQQISNERAVMPSQLQRLANLQGFFKLAGDYPVCDIKLEFPQNRPKISENYAFRDFVKKPMLNLDFANGAEASAAGGALSAPSAPSAPAPPPVVNRHTPESPVTITLSLADFPGDRDSSEDLSLQWGENSPDFHESTPGEAPPRYRARPPSVSRSSASVEDWAANVHIPAIFDAAAPPTTLKGLTNNLLQKKFE